MRKDLISVIMSTYNESEQQLECSILSIINQSYKNIEFIIINDNPENTALSNYLNHITDERVKIYENECNLGLVTSLNKAISFARGKYLARMDADDIAMPDRLEEQLSYLLENNLDMIGSDIQLINEDGSLAQRRMHFPVSHEQICKYMRWGNCLAHPTWLVKQDVYDALGGYRNVKSCEDYDFILRALATNRFRIGNLPKIELQYRIRKNGISKSTEGMQYVLRNYLSHNRININNITEENFKIYVASASFNKDVAKYMLYKEHKKAFKEQKSISRFLYIISNKFFYITQVEKYWLRKREKCDGVI